MKCFRSLHHDHFIRVWLYAEKRFFFVDDPSFLLWFDARAFLMAEKRSSVDYNPHWNGFYLYEHDGATFPAAIVRKRKEGIFLVESLHLTQQKVVLFDVKLSHLYPIAEQLAFYNVDQKTAGWLSRLIQNDTE
ncbi:MAG: hypothetical protein Q8Q56_04385 [Alphaproteobacteria bacterium]|nr:hypothetical protein [Alphaproteobacteria bacterium]